MKILSIIGPVCVILITFHGSYGTGEVDVSYNDPSDIQVFCNEYNNGWCFLYATLNKTHPRFTPVSRNASLITHVSLNSLVPLLSQDICNTFPNLVELRLSRLGIEEILPGAFDNCTNLSLIYLNENRMKRLTGDVFRYNQALESLYLYNNNIRKLDPSMFVPLVNLKNLVLYGNYLTEFAPDLVRTNKALQSLNLYKNDLLDIDEVKLTDYLPNLRLLSLNNNQLSCSRLQQIREFLRMSDVTMVDSNYETYRKRAYLQDTQDNFLCLPTQTWLSAYYEQKALKEMSSLDSESLKVSSNGLQSANI